MENDLRLLTLWLHVVAAAAWVGSMIFFAAVVVPVVRKAENRQIAGKLVADVGARYRLLGWGAIGVLVLTGMLNLGFMGIGTEQLGTQAFWHSLFGVSLRHKLELLVLVVIAMHVHDRTSGKKATEAMQNRPGSPEAERHRKFASWLGRIIMILSLAIVYFAVRLARGW